jgi:Trypsin-like peptidase domain
VLVWLLGMGSVVVYGALSSGASFTLAVGPSPSPTMSPSPIPTATRSTAEVLRDVRLSVVRIQAGNSMGTGFVVFGPGQVLTAAHVVREVTGDLSIVDWLGRSHPAQLTGIDDEHDLALLSCPQLTSPPLTLSEGVSVGDVVLAVGFAAGLQGEPSVTRGIVSARRADPETGNPLIQTDAPINPGNSGGPLLNESGEVVGVNIMRLESTQTQLANLGFAVPVEDIRSVGVLLQMGVVKSAPTKIPPTPKADQELRNYIADVWALRQRQDVSIDFVVMPLVNELKADPSRFCWVDDYDNCDILSDWTQQMFDALAELEPIGNEMQSASRSYPSEASGLASEVGLLGGDLVNIYDTMTKAVWNQDQGEWGRGLGLLAAMESRSKRVDQLASALSAR